MNFMRIDRLSFVVQETYSPSARILRLVHLRQGRGAQQGGDASHLLMKQRAALQPW